MDSATIIYIRGLPGSGKSYLATALAKSLGDGVVMLDPDRINLTGDDYARHVDKQTSEGVDPALHKYRYLRAKAYEAIENSQTIIWNQPFTDLAIFRRAVTKLRDHAVANGKNLKVVIVEVQIDPETARKRIITRKQAGGHGPSDSRFNRFIRDYRSYDNEGFLTITVDGEADADASVNKIRQSLNQT